MAHHRRSKHAGSKFSATPTAYQPMGEPAPRSPLPSPITSNAYGGTADSRMSSGGRHSSTGSTSIARRSPGTERHPTEASRSIMPRHGSSTDNADAEFGRSRSASALAEHIAEDQLSC